MVDVHDVRVAAIVPEVVEVAGGSMEPGLPRGSRVRIAPLEGPPCPGEIVLFGTPSGLLIHRVLATFTRGGERLVFHRGDHAGRIGVAAASAIRGRAVAVIAPGPHTLPLLETLDPAARRAYRVARARCLAVIAASVLARALRVGAWPGLGAVARRMRDGLLGP